MTTPQIHLFVYAAMLQGHEEEFLPLYNGTSWVEASGATIAFELMQFEYRYIQMFIFEGNKRVQTGEWNKRRKEWELKPKRGEQA